MDTLKDSQVTEDMMQLHLKLAVISIAEIKGRKSVCKRTNGQHNLIANSAVQHYHPKNVISTHNLANLSLYDHYLTIVCLFVNNFNIFDESRTMHLTNFNIISEQKINLAKQSQYVYKTRKPHYGVPMGPLQPSRFRL